MPRRKKDKCPEDLLHRLHEINRLPGPKDSDWPRFLSSLKEINEAITDLDKQTRSRSSAGYRAAVNRCIPAQFREFAMNSPIPSLVQHAPWKEVQKWIRSLQVERAELRRMVRAVREREGEIIRVPSEKHLLLDVKGIPYELDRGGPLSYILRNKIPVNSLNICPVCDRVFWEKKSGQKTCGEKKCSDTFGNWNRKRKKES